MSAKEIPMSRELLTKMLATQERLTKTDNGFSVTENVTLDLLLKGSGGASPLPKVESIVFHDDFVEARVAEASYCLPYANLVGVKITTRGERTAPRAGFVR